MLLRLLPFVLLLAACVPAQLPDMGAFLASSGQSQPAMRWDHRPEASEWTSRSLLAISAHDDVLASKIPADIATFCPGYAKASLANRRAFWSGLISAVAKYESSWNPSASGGGGRYIGIMQISPKSASQHGCTARTASALKNGGANLECAVEMAALQVGNDGVVAGSGKRGVGRDWMPLRKAQARAEIAAWTSAQSYCR